MVKVYAVALVIGVIGLLIVVLGGALADNLGRPDLDPAESIGAAGKVLIGAMLGFAMGGLSAEFSPLDLTWQTALFIALGASAVATIWVRYSISHPDR